MGASVSYCSARLDLYRPTLVTGKLTSIISLISCIGTQGKGLRTGSVTVLNIDIVNSGFRSIVSKSCWRFVVSLVLGISFSELLTTQVIASGFRCRKTVGKSDQVRRV